MASTLSLFALDARRFAKDLENSQSSIISRTSHELARNVHDESERRQLVARVERIVAGDIPPECGSVWFGAFLAIADANLERIPFPDLDRAPSSVFINAVGVLEPLAKDKPPFAVPRAGVYTTCRIGYLPSPAMQDFAFHQSGELAEQDRSELEGDLAEVLVELGMAGPEAKEHAKLSMHVEAEHVQAVREEFLFALETLRRDQLDLLTVLC